MPNPLNITGIPKPLLVKALYRHARPQGLGFFWDSGSDELPDVDALGCANDGDLDYVGGRPIKCDIRGDTVDPWLFDRDNGDGACSEAVAWARQQMVAVAPNA